MLITVVRFFEPSEAQVVKALLESEGFFVHAASEFHVYADYPLSLALGGIRLLVPIDQAEGACNLVKAYEQGNLVSDISSEIKQEADCCDAPSVQWQTSFTDKSFAFAIWLFFGVTYPVAYAFGVCKRCGHRHMPFKE